MNGSVNLAEGPLIAIQNVPIGSKVYVWLNSAKEVVWGPGQDAVPPGTLLPEGNSGKWGPGSGLATKIIATVIRAKTLGWISISKDSIPTNTHIKSSVEPGFSWEGEFNSGIILQIIKGNFLMNTNALVTAASTTATKEAMDAAWRTAASTSLKMVRQPLLAALKKNGADEGALETVSNLLETDAGSAVFAIMLGTMLSGAPVNNPKITRLASELRILGFQNFTDQFAEIFAVILSGLVSSLPEASLPEA